MAAGDPTGLIGQVTCTVQPGQAGEVHISTRGGTQVYTAYPYDGKEVIPNGTQISVISFLSPITVYVSRLALI